MKAEELRKGNFVLLKGDVIELIGNYDLFRACANCERDEDYKPIPLTEEWLFKFGFTDYEWCNDCAFIKMGNKCLMVRLINNEWTFYKKIVSKDSKGHKMSGLSEKVVNDGLIKYVHQIQNLYFALTGKELEIK